MGCSDQGKQGDLALSIVLISIGSFLFVANLLFAYDVLIRPSMEGFGFESPGSLEFETASPGVWTVMHQSAGTFDGRQRSASSGDAVGLSIEISRVADGSQVTFEHDSSFSIAVGTTERQSVGRFSTNAPGQYRINAQGNARPIVLYATEWSSNVSLSKVAPLAILQLVAIGLGFVGVKRLIKARRMG